MKVFRIQVVTGITTSWIDGAADRGARVRPDETLASEKAWQSVSTDRLLLD